MRWGGTATESERGGESQSGDQQQRKVGLMGKDTSPYVWMFKGKLLMDSIMDDNIRTPGNVVGGQ